MSKMLSTDFRNQGAEYVILEAKDRIDFRNVAVDYATQTLSLLNLSNSMRGSHYD